LLLVKHFKWLGHASNIDIRLFTRPYPAASVVHGAAEHRIRNPFGRRRHKLPVSRGR